MASIAINYIDLLQLVQLAENYKKGGDRHMRYAQVRSMDISDGPFIRVGFYTQGCPLR